MTRDEAAAVAITELLYTKGVVAEVTDVHQYDSNGHTLLYEVVCSNGNAVLITGNKQCIPVVGRYETTSDSSIFERYFLPCGLRLLLHNYVEQVVFCFDNPRQTTYNHYWNAMINGNSVYLNRDIGSVAPLIKTAWEQSGTFDSGQISGYDHYIEAGGDCEHCKVGCVAVAMGQVMNYWKWPVFIHDNWQFDWCNMCDTLKSFSNNFYAERNAIARLLERCGKYAGMHYGCSESTSNVYKAKKAFDRFFL